MPRVLIETYRSWDIWLDTDNEKFIAENGVNENEKGKPSLAAARKFVDEFRRANAEFKPFEVVNIGWGKEAMRVVGIRKDGRYVAEDGNGVKSQISDYYEKDYALPNPDNDAALAEIARLESEKDKLHDLIKAQRTTLVWTTLRDFKQTQDYSDFVA